MTKKEVAKLLAVLAAAYPRLNVSEMTVKVWHEMLGDISYEAAGVAAKKLMLTNTFPPSIAELREAATAITSPQVAPGVIAWGEIKRAIQKYGYYRENEGLGSLSPATRKAVECIGWKEFCMSDDPEGVIRGQFIKLYEQVATQERESRLMPDELKGAISALASRMSVPQLKEAENDQGLP